jgi:copper(I)-binding protein
MPDFPSSRFAGASLARISPAHISPAGIFRSALLGFLLTILLATPFEHALAETSGVTALDAWARPSPGGTTNGAAYVTLEGGAQPDQLIGASTPVASTAEVHETIDDKGIMRMRSAPSVTVSPGQTVTFAPGGYHIMLMGLKKPLVASQNFPLTLKFAHAAPVTLDVQVRTTAGHDHSMGGHDQMQMK